MTYGKCLAVAATFLTFCARAGAAPLAPGATILTPPEADPIGGVIVAGGAPVPFASPSGPTPFTGTLTSTVISGDTTNPLGGLTFTFRLHNDATSLSTVGRLTTLDYTGFVTDVSYQSPGAGRPSTATDRTAPPAATIGWDFSALGLGRLNPGEDSALLVIQTDAHFFQPSDANVIDGSIAIVSSFGPAVPEPASIGFFLLGANALRRRSSAL